MIPLIQDCVLVALDTVGFEVTGNAIIANCLTDAGTSIYVNSGVCYVLGVEGNTYGGAGTVEPLDSDRSAWDALNFQDHHANDINAAAGVHHTLGSVGSFFIEGSFFVEMGGAAGGDLSGTYPNPSVVNDSHNHTFTTMAHDTLDGLTDVVITSPTTGDVLTYNGANWAQAEPTISAQTTPYTAKTSSTSGDPLSGKLLWNNATQTSATEINISDHNLNGVDVSMFFELFQTGDTLVIQSKAAASKYQKWTVSGAPVDHTTYYTIPVTFVSSAGGTFANNDNIYLVWETGAGAGSIGGSTGATDNAIIRADGTGGSTVQNSAATIDDSGTVNLPTGQTYNINGSPHTHASGVARSGSTTDGHLAVWDGTNADSIKDGGAVPAGGGGMDTTLAIAYAVGLGG